MAWSNTTQFQGKVAFGPAMEYGYLTLGAAGTVSCTTRLRSVQFGQASFKSGNLAVSNLTVGTTIASGAITITDQLGAVNAGAVIHYQLFGLL